MKNIILKTMWLISILIFFTGVSTALTVTSIDPVSGYNNGSYSATLYGTDFPVTAQTEVVLFYDGVPNIIATDVTSHAPTQNIITCSFPLNTQPAGIRNVSVQNTSTVSYGNITSGYTIKNPIPTITGISPTTGLSTGTTSPTITGTNFMNGAKVNLTRTGYSNITGTVVSVIATTIDCTFTLTGATPGVWNIAVTNTDGQVATKENCFTIVKAPTVTGISPSTGVNTGSVPSVTLAGTGFINPVKVNLTRSGKENITASDLVLDSASRIFCTLPITGKDYGQWNVEVTNFDGQIGTLTNGFTITNPAPTVSGIEPSSGLNTASLKITNLAGTGFISGATVNLTRSGQTNITATGVNVESATKINCTLPITDRQPGKWTVWVTNPDGQAISLTEGFNVTGPAPTFTSITPSSGINTRTVTISNLVGTGFQNDAEVVLNKTGQTNITATDVTVMSSSRIICRFPIRGAALGQWNVIITNPDNQAVNKTNAFTVTANGPRVTSITPSTAQNTATVTITSIVGSRFQTSGTTRVNLTRTGYANITATNVQVPISTLITCKFPITGKMAGQWNVTVTNPDDQSGTLTNGFTITSLYPSIFTFSPRTASTFTNTTATITGANFKTGVIVQMIRGSTVRSATITSRSTSTIICTLPTKNAAGGAWNVKVRNTDGRSVLKRNAFTVNSNPIITKISPNYGSPVKNTTVTITGNGFRSGAVVQMIRGSSVKKATVTSLSSTRIVCTFPTKWAPGGLWNVKITNTNGTKVLKYNAFTVKRSSTASTENVIEVETGAVSGIVSKTEAAVPSISIPSQKTTLSGGVVVPVNKPAVSPVTSGI